MRGSGGVREIRRNWPAVNTSTCGIGACLSVCSCVQSCFGDFFLVLDLVEEVASGGDCCGGGGGGGGVCGGAVGGGMACDLVGVFVVTRIGICTSLLSSLARSSE